MDLLQLSVTCPGKLPLWSELLQQPDTVISHPNPEVISLHAWLLSTEVSQRNVFPSSLEDSFRIRGGQAPRMITPANLTSSVAGVIQGKLIPIQPL